MQLTPIEESILQTLAQKAKKGITGYVNLTEALAPKTNVQEIREGLSLLEEKSLARYMRTQDRSLSMGQITDAGMAEVSQHKNSEGLWKRFDGFFEQIKKRRVVAALALVIVAVGVGGYFQRGSFQANVLETSDQTPEAVVTEYIKQYLDPTSEKVSVDFAGQLNDNYFYQADTETNHYLFTLEKDGTGWKITDSEILHR